MAAVILSMMGAVAVIYKLLEAADTWLDISQKEFAKEKTANVVDGEHTPLT